VLTIACVLKSGGYFTPDWVGKLARACERHAPAHRFVCLSDVDVPCERIALTQNWPGWWSKLELFRPGLFDGTVVYFDLDTVILKPFPGLAGFTEPFGMLQDFYEPERLASGVMAWNGQHADIYATLKADPGLIERTEGGDQTLIGKLRPDAVRLQTIENIVSYKDKCSFGRGPGDASVVCWHGRPRIDECKRDWVLANWL
jgi:hypothetical protein